MNHSSAKARFAFADEFPKVGLPLPTNVIGFKYICKRGLGFRVLGKTKGQVELGLVNIEP